LASTEKEKLQRSLQQCNAEMWCGALFRGVLWKWLLEKMLLRVILSSELSWCDERWLC
jgi:hypothetical protein